MRRKLRAKHRTKHAVKRRAGRRSKPRYKLRRPVRSARHRSIRTRKKARRRSGKTKLRLRRYRRIKGKSVKARRRKKREPAVPSGYSLDPERFAALREQGAAHRQNLQRQERVIQALHSLFRLDSEDFVWQLYLQFLHREPAWDELHYFMTKLIGGASKTDILSELVRGDEAQAMMAKQPDSGPGSPRTVTAMIRSFIHTVPSYFVCSAYNHLLSRYPDQTGAAANLGLLADGTPRASIVANLMLSPESQKLLAAPEPPNQLVHPSGTAATHIGIFLGFSDQVSLSGEGIGRFTARLAEGLLAHSADTVLYVVTGEINLDEVRRLTDTVDAVYPGRLFVLPIPNMDWVNAYVPVDKWIVPYAGMAMALQLQKPVIVCLHDMVYKHFPADYYSVDPEFCNRLDRIVTPLARKAAAVVFNSEFIRKHEGLQFLSLPPDKTHVIRLAPPSEEYGTIGLADEFAFRQSYGLHAPYLVYPSAIRLHKNHDRLVEAFLAYKMSPEGRQNSLQLVMTDDWNNVNLHTAPIFAKIKVAIAACPDPQARASIRFIGRIPAQDLPSLYKYAFGTIVPTLFEGSCPFPILESLLMDTPVAVSRLEVTGEIIPTMSAFVTFDPYSIPEIHNAIHELSAYNRSLLPAEKTAISEALKRNWSDVAREYYNLVKMS